MKSLVSYLLLIVTLNGCAWTPERVSKMSEFDLCYQQWFEKTLWFAHKERIRVVNQEVSHRKAVCSIHERHIKERYEQYLRDIDFAVEIGKFGGGR
jgi:hypothetical protein